MTDPEPAGAPSAAPAEAVDTVNNAVTDAILRHRTQLFAFVLLLFALAFNAQWRIGRDSALFRGLGHSLATGQGYRFGDFASQTVYPGLPVLLAGLERVFGSSPVPPMLVILAMAGLTLVVTYRLVLLRYPPWVAVAVTFLLGINARFLQLAQEIMTDVPFVLGVVMALYGWELLRNAIRPRAKLAALLWLIAGLALAAAMRPTVWILAAAWGAVCLWGVARGPRRRFHAACLAVMAGVLMVAVLADPRMRGIDPLSGGYERDAVARFRDAGRHVADNLVPLLFRDFPSGFFGQRFFHGFTETASVLVIGASLLLWRRQPLWTLLVLFTVAVTLVMTTVPRYYLMAMAPLLVGWISLLCAIAGRTSRVTGERVLLGGLVLVAALNLSRDAKVIVEQRRVPFLQHYHDGDYDPIVRFAPLLARHVPPDGLVIGPEATVLSYLSERRVLISRELFPANLPPQDYPRHLASLGIDFAVFPSHHYRKGEHVIGDLMEHGVIVPVRTVARAAGMDLAKIRIDVPAGDWREAHSLPVATAPATRGATTRRKKPTTAQVRRQHAARLAARAAAERRARAATRRAAQLARQERAEREAARRRREIREARQRREAKARRERAARQRRLYRRATTAPITAPITMPVQSSRGRMHYFWTIHATAGGVQWTGELAIVL